MIGVCGAYKLVQCQASALQRRMKKAVAQLAGSTGTTSVSHKKSKKKKDKKGSKGRSGAPQDFLFTLVNDEESISGELSVPPEERQRRQVAASWKVGLHLVINKKQVTRLGPASLDWPAYSCNFKSAVPLESKTRQSGPAGGGAKPSTVNLRLRRRPASIELEVRSLSHGCSSFDPIIWSCSSSSDFSTHHSEKKIQV